MQSRRSFLALSAAAMAAPALAARMPDPIANRIVINALGGLDGPHTDAGLFLPEALADIRRSGLTAVNWTLGYVSGPDDPFEFSVSEIADMDVRIRAQSGDFLKVLTAADIRRAKAERKVGIIYGFQNGAQLGKDPARVNLFAGLGVRVFQLTYNPANQLGDGSMAPGNRGITPLAREMIARMNEQRVMVDLSHSGETTCLEAARASAKPISINHTGCRALADLPRNKTDAELRLVADKGGFVGIYFMPFLKSDSHPHAEDVVAHIDHAVNVCGEDHVGIGTDGGIAEVKDLKAYHAQVAAEVEARRKAGIGATGETADVLKFIPDLQGPDQFRKLATLLAAKGYGPRRIDKILGGNFLSYAEMIWGA